MKVNRIMWSKNCLINNLGGVAETGFLSVALVVLKLDM